MRGEALKLTAYVGERDRTAGRLVADALMDLYERSGMHASALIRGVEGFGIKHRLQTERLLTLSEDLPMVAIAVGSSERVEAMAGEVPGLTPGGLITLERALLLGAGADASRELPPGPDEIKLTLYLGRGERAGGRPAHLAVVELLHRHGVAGASVLLGVDGMAHGTRHRARLLASNAQVPLMIISVGERTSIASALTDLGAILRDPVITLERVCVCKRDGILLAEPPPAPASADDGGLAYWQKLTLFAGGRAEHEGQPLYGQLIRRLRRAGAAGATAMRGQWGYHGEHAPHGERFWSLRRHLPVLTVLLDTPANMRRWFAIVDELTAETGLVTSELVPALRAGGPEVEHGGLRLAPPHASDPARVRRRRQSR
jgi:PII-like signaling protein